MLAIYFVILQILSILLVCAGTMDEIATRKQILHALAASFLQARCDNNYFELKNEEAIKKSENLSDTFP